MSCQNISWVTLDEYIRRKSILIVDVRSESEFKEKHIKYAVNITYDEMEEIINETIERIQNQLKIDLKENNEFYTGITLHFYPALDRLQNNQQLTNNPLKDQVQSQHETEFKCTEIFNSVVEEHYHKSFNEHELAYIALHFGTALKKKRNFQKVPFLILNINIYIIFILI